MCYFCVIAVRLLVENANVLTSGMDHLNLPVALVNGKGSDCYTNAPFEQVLVQRSIIGVSNRKLVFLGWSITFEVLW
jgi:hypothetical protein